MQHRDSYDRLHAVRPVGNRITFFQECAARAGDGDWAEFGVWRGKSANMLLNIMPTGRSLWLFDSFKGFPEDYCVGFGKGVLALDAPPDFHDQRARVMPGWFEDVLPGWEHHEPLAMIHMDADLYSSTKYVLDTIRPLIASGTVIMFDQVFDLPFKFSDGVTWHDHEWKAWHEFADDAEIDFQWIARTKIERAALIIR